MEDATLDDFGPAVLFCPGDRPDRFQKAIDGADNAVLDLEDGTAPTNRDMARDAIVAFLKEKTTLLAVRINHPTTARGLADAAAVLAAGAQVLLLPKTESVKEIDAVAALGRSALIATIESARGALAMREILAHPAVWAVSWGPYDLAGDMGMRKVRDDNHNFLTPLAMVRDHLLVNAAAERKVAIDTVTAEIKNLALLTREAREAANFGFQAKFSIHPSQIPVVRSAFRPPDAEVDRARRMVEASTGRGAFSFEGEMVDEPILRRARRIISAAERMAPKSRLSSEY